MALYGIEVHNDIIPYSGGAFYFTAGKTRRVGIEVGGRLLLSNGISIGTAIAFSRNRYVDYQVDSVHYGNPGKFLSLKNNLVAGVPDRVFSIDLRYSPPAHKQAYVKASVHGIGSYYADDANKFSIPASATLDARIGLESTSILNDRLMINGFLGVDNLTNSNYTASAWINPDLVNGKPVFLEPGLPRSVSGGVSLGWNF